MVRRCASCMVRRYDSRRSIFHPLPSLAPLLLLFLVLVAAVVVVDNAEEECERECELKTNPFPFF